MSCTKNGTRHYFIVLYLLKEKDFICISVFCQVLPASISFIRKNAGGILILPALGEVFLFCLLKYGLGYAQRSPEPCHKGCADQSQIPPVSRNKDKGQPTAPKPANRGQSQKQRSAWRGLPALSVECGVPGQKKEFRKGQKQLPGEPYSRQKR